MVAFVRSGALSSLWTASRKLRAAFMGPMVCELEGPGPVLKISKMEVVM